MMEQVTLVLKKMSTKCALTFDVRTSKEDELKFYNMYPTGENASTTESLFQAVDGALKKDELNWFKCVNIGCNNSMQARILNEKKLFYSWLLLSLGPSCSWGR